MTRFVAPNLAGLPPPPAVEALDFETILAARIADLQGRLEAKDLSAVAALLVLESEPLTIAQQTGANFELVIRQRINDAVRSNLIASATGADLDQLVATFYGVERLVLVAEDLDADPPVPAVLEKDDDFRARAVLSLEARSTAGPEGAYVYFALSADPDVLDVACYGEEDDAVYAGSGNPVLAPEVLLVVLSRVGDGEPADELLDTVAAAVNAEEVRPIGDKVTVEPATITPYAVAGVVKHRRGADPAPLLAAATAQVQAYCDARRRIGRVVQVLGIGAAMKVTDAEELELSSPVADIDPGSKGAAYCTSITLTAEVVEDDWR
ncbi:baseplate assembly protein [Caulobacter sp. RL271]|uniref:Baseplate J/gp47 family protein n=1 Tax=Caulobacter segnis TaxID=88688 RepID=A0ABY4ZXG2_9CAUL|nr:baseplate J/gp47 family protein [Caulobacter segnis]USQ97243.1 baseplate J/gp47 family protein [Caulobacter segnis]